MNSIVTIRERHFRTIWISDVHLGTRGCKAELLLDFLKHNDSDILYLVGDIVDGWRLKRSWYWPQSHNDLVQKVLRRARKGCRVLYIPGNHDELFRGFADLQLGGIEVVAEAIHETVEGKRLLVLHGDQFDGVIRYAKWLAFLGDRAYVASLALNHWLNLFRRRFGHPYWSLSAYLKTRVKKAVQYVSDFEVAVAHEAFRRGVDGVVCGHIHKPELRWFGPILYCNDGDWVESCTALVEHPDGQLEIIEWAREHQLPFAPAGLAA